MATPPLITTKFHRPPTMSDLVPRPHLLARLNRNRQRPLTLISAPPGYGKTTLVSNWLDSISHSIGWVSLDEQDDDLNSFLAYFLAAVQNLFSEAISDTMALFNAPELPPVRVLTSTLINDLVQIEQPFMLVLDDFHTIRNMDVLDLVNGLLRYPPPGMHLVLITRKDPPINLTNLRARGRITEIRVQELRFNESEVREYLGSLTQDPIDSQTIKLLTEKSEGWITGLRLITLSKRHVEAIDWSKISHLVNNHLVEDYLMSVILDLQEHDFVNCLLKTAVLERFCAPLCTAVCGPDNEFGHPFDGDSFINKLRRSNLFIIPLDSQYYWFRYHHLFQELLLRQLEKRLGKTFIAKLHGRASVWYARNGFIDEALRHALKSGDTVAAVALVAQHRQDLMNREEWRRLDRWLNQFPHETIEAYPELLILYAWVQFYLWYDIGNSLGQLERVEYLLQTSNLETSKARQIAAEAAAIRSQFQYYYADTDSAIAAAEQVQTDTPAAFECVWSSAIISQGGAYQLLGNKEKALSTLEDLLQAKTFQSPSSNARLMFALCAIHWSDGDLGNLLQIAGQLLRYSEENQLGWSSSYAHYYLGIAQYERNNLDVAVEHLEYLVRQPYRFPFHNVCQSVLPLALIYANQGNSKKAREVASSISNLAFERQNSIFIGLSTTLKTELDIREGQTRSVVNWVNQYTPDQFVTLHRFYIPELTYVRALLAVESSANHEEADRVLTLFSDHYRKTHSTVGSIKALTLRALLATKQGDETQALTSLEQAVRLAEPGLWIRPFVDLGSEIAGLLRQLLHQGIAPDYIRQILAAFPNASILQPSDPITNGEFEPLTNREMEILLLLGQRLTNKEIANQLFLSIGTVKQHLNHIYSKLDVNGRRQAVIKAQKLEII